MPATANSLQAISYGYLSGADLATWCNTQLLIAQQNVRPNILQKSVDTAIAEVKSKLGNVYDLTEELSKTDTLLPVLGFTIGNGIITAVSILSPGSNFIGAPSIAITDKTGTGAGVTATVGDTTVKKVEILCGGRGFKQPPTITFVGGNPTRPAAGVATLNSWGGIASITITDPGSGYQAPPSITITAVQGGQFASAIALMNYGVLTGVTLTAGGTNYVAPSPVFTGGQIADPREPRLVKLISIYAVRNALGSNHNIAEKMMDDFKGADEEIQQLRAGLDKLEIYTAVKQLRSEPTIVKDSFSQLG